MDDTPRQRRSGLTAIADWTDRLTRRPFGKRGLAEASLIADWPAVVGPAIASGTLPLKIVFPQGERANGTLHLRVGSGALALELQHGEPLLVQRINSHFGYAAVARINLSQGLIPRRPTRARPAPVVDPETERQLTDKCAAVTDPELRDALTALGRRLAARR